MPTSSQIIVTDSFPITSADTPVKLHISFTGGVNEAATAWVCDTLSGSRKNSFTNETIGIAAQVKDNDLVVVSRLVDMDKDADSFTYKFKVTAGDKVYQYTKTKKFDPSPTKGQSVKFTTILSL